MEIEAIFLKIDHLIGPKC